MPRRPAGTAGCAVIGDQLRLPTAWCEMTPCIERHTDPAALGEADVRARAINAGWQLDALGRLACPGCQQRDPRFAATGPVVPWNRTAAIRTAAGMAAARRRGAGPRGKGRHRQR